MVNNLVRNKQIKVGNKIKSKTGIEAGGHIMDKEDGKDIISRFEKVLQKHFGPTGVYILNVQINNLGRTKEMMRKEDMERLIEGLKDELIKVIRYDVELLEKELREILENE